MISCKEKGLDEFSLKIQRVSPTRRVSLRINLLSSRLPEKKKFVIVWGTYDFIELHNLWVINIVFPLF